MPNKTTIEIDGKNGGAITAINGVKKELLSLGPLGGKMSSILSSVFNPGTLALGAVAGLSAIAKQSINTADELSKMSQKVGVSIEDLSTLRYAAKLADVDLEGLADGFKKLNKNAVDAAEGTGAAKDAFSKLGIEVKDSSGHIKRSIDLMYETADQFSNLRDGSNKTALAIEIFGRAGADLIPLLNEGSAGLREMQIEARAMGLEISTKTGKQAEEFNDNLEKLKMSFQGLANKALPWLTTQLSHLGWMVEHFSWGNLILSDNQIDRMILLEKFPPLLTYHQMPKDLTDTIDKWKEEEKARQKAIADAQKLRDSWQDVSDKLKNEVLLFGLGPLEKAQIELNMKVQELKEKYNSIPGSLAVIDRYYDQILQKSLAISSNNILPKGYEVPKIPEQFNMQPIDTTGIDANQQHMMDLSTQLSAWQILNSQTAKDSMINDYNLIQDAMYGFYDASGQKSKEFFGVYKAMAIAQTAVATYTSAVEAYKSMVGIPIVGPALAIAAAAAATAFGLSNIARIASMQPGGGAGGGVSASVPSLPVSNVTNNSTTNQVNNSPQVTVIVNGWVDDKDRFAREMIDAFSKAAGDRLGGG